MKYVVISILILLIVFLGFQVYKIIDREIDEAQISSIMPVSGDLEDLTVDSIENINNYTQRLSTYTETSRNLLKAALNHMTDLRELTAIFYFENDALIRMEVSDDADLGQIKGDIIILYPENTELQSNLTHYDKYLLDDRLLIHFKPEQTGLYMVENDLKITFELIDIK